MCGFGVGLVKLWSVRRAGQQRQPSPALSLSRAAHRPMKALQVMKCGTMPCDHDSTPLRS